MNEFSLKPTVEAFERVLVRKALVEAGGSVSNAARLLGVSHQTLVFMLQTRHKALASHRKTPIPRRRSIIKR